MRSIYLTDGTEDRCRRSAIAVVLLMFLSSLGNAQTFDRRIAAIDRVVKQVNEQIAQSDNQGKYSSIFRNELVVNQRDNPWPAVGTYRRVITFYYTYGDREKDPYPSRLLKVTVFTNRSDQQEFESYTFNRHEQLIFAQSRTDDEPPAEQTYYFAANRLIGRWNKGEKVSVNTVDANSNSASVRSTAGKLDNVFRASLD